MRGVALKPLLSFTVPGSMHQHTQRLEKAPAQVQDARPAAAQVEGKAPRIGGIQLRGAGRSHGSGQARLLSRPRPNPHHRLRIAAPAG